MIFHITGTYPQVIQRLRHFAVILVNTVHLEQIERSEFLTHLQGTVRAYREQVISQQLSQFVLIVGNIERRSPIHFSQIHVSVDRKLHAIIAHRTDIVSDTSETTCSVQRHRIQQIVRILQINVRNHIQLSVPETKVETKIVLVGGLPCQCVISHTGDSHTAIISVVDTSRHQRLPCIIADTILITRLTVTQTELQICPVKFPERFF